MDDLNIYYKYIEEILIIINDFTSRYGKVLTIDEIKLPLTCSSIGLSGNDLFELYLILCKCLSVEIKLEDYYDFYSIDRIALTIIRQKREGIWILKMNWSWFYESLGNLLLCLLFLLSFYFPFCLWFLISLLLGIIWLGWRIIMLKFLQ